ncbi:MAG: GNAT family N-acetyltransferase [Chloroflexi bacterium HGW-Chloroflexi-3]|nr:MAG: GNAT family N-acetyltransferase [Chloroflexi bacterium HGW-Chloroflexi-3]
MSNIRLMDMGDYPQLIDLWRNTENIGLSKADSPVNLDAFLQRNPGLSFVILDDDKIIGTLLGGHDGRRGAIYHLAVNKEYRYKGYGKALLNHCLAAFADIGIERCHIHVYADNQSGLDFWQKHGWFTRPELVLLSKDIGNPVKVDR